VSEPISERIDALASATIVLTQQVTILSEAVIDLRRLREQQQDLFEQQVATDQRARLGMMHALDASDQVHNVDSRVDKLTSQQALALKRTGRGVRFLLWGSAVLVAAFLALQIDNWVDQSCPRPADATSVSKTLCTIALPGQPNTLPDTSVENP
jgi:high-affinity nickel permease